VITRRGLLVAGTGAAVGAGAARALDSGDAPHEGVGTGRVEFHGARQAGIVTPAQDRLVFAAFDLRTRDRDELRYLLETWTAAGAQLTQGEPVPGPSDVGAAPPADTGEAAGLASARLTVTFGFGPSLFDERFGLAAQRPGKLRDLPRLPGDELDPERSGGDLCVQACADDPQVAFHAVRNLARLARGVAVMRWSQLGFGRTSTTSRSQSTPRNLMGFKDGTNNVRAEDTKDLAEHVWVPEADGPAWLAGGTYMVTRRIRMLIESWDRAPLADQEDTIGRTKLEGAPLGGEHEFDEVDLADQPANAHVALAQPSKNGGVKMLRRGYSFTDGMDSRLGELDAGLFFIAFQRDPEHFVRVQRRLGSVDALNEYIKHVSSAVFAVPPGVGRGEFVGQSLFA
jgi:deferrochelatase/peroxidase EfeB